MLLATGVKSVSCRNLAGCRVAICGNYYNFNTLDLAIKRILAKVLDLDVENTYKGSENGGLICVLQQGGHEW